MDYDPAQDFSSFRKYTWHDQVVAPDQLVAARIRNAIEEGLAARGYTRVGSTDDADFRVSFTAVAEQALDFDSVSAGMGYRGRGWGAGIPSTTRVREYTRGTLVVDVIDASGKNLLWRGSSARKLLQDRSVEDKDRDVREIVSAILREFPPLAE
ncbi:MAG: DUF4136 domain-containing protein [Gammaproteobacteria bacterium]|nr:DUF4136 domain-containing protein [Gammaproteobacteria bacterium]